MRAEIGGQGGPDGRPPMLPQPPSAPPMLGEAGGPEGGGPQQEGATPVANPDVVGERSGAPPARQTQASGPYGGAPGEIIIKPDGTRCRLDKRGRAYAIDDRGDRVKTHGNRPPEFSVADWEALSRMPALKKEYIEAEKRRIAAITQDAEGELGRAEQSGGS